MSATYEHNDLFRVTQVKGGYDNNFLHIITCLKTGKNILVDAPIRLNAFSNLLDGKPDALLITHSHGDHTAYMDEYRNEFHDLKLITGGATLLSDLKDMVKLSDNEFFRVGDLQIKLIETPGHHPDSVCFSIEDALFTGDTLFIGRTGRVVSAESNISDLYHSVYNKLLRLEQDIFVYPGHDYGPRPRLSIRENISISPLLQADSLNDFIERMNNFESEK